MSDRARVSSFEQMRAEAMFASEQLLAGLKRLASVPDPGAAFLPYSDSLAFPALYSGLLPLSNAFERICKLGLIALAANSGQPTPAVRNFGHRTVELVRELSCEAARFDWRAEGWSSEAAEHLVRIVEAPWANAYLDLLEKYGAMAGRYEMIDGLAGASASAVREPIFELWTALPFEPLSEKQQHLCAVRDLASDLLESDSVPTQDSNGEAVLELLRLTFSDSRIWLEPNSLARVLRFHELGAAIARVLREASTLGFYRHAGGPVFPDMADVIEAGTFLDADSFVGLVILGFSDDDMALEVAEPLFGMLDFDDD